MNFVYAQEIIDKPVPMSENRLRLTREYSQKHYGTSQTEIIPQAVVIHWTAGPTWESAYYTFYNDDRGDGTVNVSSQFIVDRDGTIYRITPENFLARHVIGYNHCAIGIENVGGVDNVEDLTDAQLAANIFLINYLRGKFPTIKYIFGHYQQTAARESGLYIENVQGYYSLKSDPGPKFMGELKKVFENDGLIFFPL
ncbi:MAG: N-acetylmuramoyl-L-alanine amidase [Selenomonadaceae bacterium]|nr:N-acetylmuramoyl-L-alanine amidase [Selenomonadaceae bacterium]